MPKNSKKLEDIYEKAFLDSYNVLIEFVSNTLNNDNGKRLEVKHREVSQLLYKKLQGYSEKSITPGGSMPDFYTEALFREYDSRINEYVGHRIDLFIDEYLKEIKDKFKNKELSIPSHIEFNEEDTVELIAQREAARQFLRKFDMLKNATTIEEILLKVKLVSFENENINRNTQSMEFKDEEIPLTTGDTEQIKRFKKEFTLMRQMIAFKYLIKHIEIKSAVADVTKFAEFARFITGRDLGSSNIKNSNVYKFLNLPFRKLTKSQVKDFEYVIAYFQDLGMTKIVAEMQVEIDKAKQKSENIG